MSTFGRLSNSDYYVLNNRVGQSLDKYVPVPNSIGMVGGERVPLKLAVCLNTRGHRVRHHVP